MRKKQTYLEVKTERGFGFVTFESIAEADAALEGGEHKLGEKEIEVKVPVTFSPLTPAEVVSRYLSNSTPLVVYGDQERVVDFGISRNTTRWKAEDAVILKDFYKASILSTYTKVDFVQEGLKEINGQQFIAFEFQSEVKDKTPNAIGRIPVVRKYIYLLYALKNGQLYVFNFSAPGRDGQQWKDTAVKMMESIKFL